MVVDLGVGTGLLAMRAARAVSRGRVVAVDASTGCLEQLQKNCDKISVSNVETIVACLERLPFGSQTFDAALCRSALCFAGDFDRTVSEMGRVLVTGGRFSVFEPLMGEAAWRAGEGEDVKEFLEMEKILRERRGPSSVDRVKLRDAFEKAGLRPFESFVVYFSLTSEGRSEEGILRGYLYDLPGEFSAFSVLKYAH